MPHPVSTRRYGRRPLKKQFSGVHLGNYWQPELMAIPLPDSLDWTTKYPQIITPVFRNNVLGCCVISDQFRAFLLWLANATGQIVVGTDTEVDTAYHTICGLGDNGCDPDEVSAYARDHGIVIGGQLRKIDDFVAIATSVNEAKLAILLFGRLRIALQVPYAWENTPVWVPTSSPIAGGHDVLAYGWNAQGLLIASWGEPFVMTWAAFLASTWVEFCRAELAPDWYSNANLSPYGVSTVALRADLAQIKAGQTPTNGPTPAPPIPVPVPVPIPPVNPPAPPSPPAPPAPPSPPPPPVTPRGLSMPATCKVVNDAVNAFSMWNPMNLRRRLYQAIANAIAAAWPPGAP